MIPQPDLATTSKPTQTVQETWPIAESLTHYLAASRMLSVNSSTFRPPTLSSVRRLRRHRPVQSAHDYSSAPRNSKTAML